MKIFDFFRKNDNNITNDPYKVLNKNGERELTLQKICSIMSIDIPDRFIPIKDVIRNNVAVRPRYITSGGCAFLIDLPEAMGVSVAKWCEACVSAGAEVLFIDEDLYYENGLDQCDYPIIPAKSLRDKAGVFFNYIKELNGLKTITVTGTCGKTTAMSFLRNVVPDHFNTVMNAGNINSFRAVAHHIMTKISPDKEIYIQETGAGSLNSLRTATAMLQPDIAVILNVYKHHINHYKTFENIFNDKVSVDDNMKEDGVIIANFDDEGLANYPFKHKVTSFGITTDKKVDYRAINIKQNNQFLEFDVVNRNKTTTHIKISIIGEHNVYNALAAYSVCRTLGIPGKEISKGLRKYSSNGIRQNFKIIAGYNMLIDCYNLCEQSLKADLDAIRSFSIEDGKKIAIITGENKLANTAEETTFRVGKTLDLSGIDHVICVGIPDETDYNLNYYCHGRALYEGILSQGYKNVVYVTNPKDLQVEIDKVKTPGDLLLFKGVLYLDLAPVIDNIFGTAFSLENGYYISRSIPVENEYFIGRKIEVVEGIDLKECKIENCVSIKIPDEIDGYRIHRISGKIFNDNSHLKKVDFGNSVVNIGRKAFMNCTGLEEIEIPSSVKFIGANAFSGCTNLKKVIINEGTMHIGPGAFKDCSSLETLVIPKSATQIAKSAFAGCNKLITG